MTMTKIILVIAAHPDDEVLGCGATIAKHVKMDDEVHVVVLAEGVTSRDEMHNPDGRKSELSELSKAAHRANRILGVKSLNLHNFPDNRMDSVDRLDVIKVVESFIKEYQPDIIYTHHVGDVNIDHRIIHEAVVTACRPLPLQTVKTLLFFEVPSSSEWQPSVSAEPFNPDWFVDISKTLSIKLEALQAYEAELRAFPHPRSLSGVKALAQWRGGTVGVEAAEAFILGRKLI